MTMMMMMMMMMMMGIFSNRYYAAAAFTLATKITSRRITVSTSHTHKK